MTETADAVQNGFVLRMSVPASGDIATVGPELGVKLAEQLGVAPAQAAKVGETMAELAQALGATSGELSFAFHKAASDLRIEARHGDTARTATVSLGA